MNKENIIQLYKSFDRYKNLENLSLHLYLHPCFHLKQYKIFEDENGIYGFTNWAFLDKKSQLEYLKTGIIKNWNCGKEMVHVDIVTKKNVNKIYKWCRKNLAEKLGLGKTTYWLRLNKDNSIRLTVEKTTKEDWLWVQ